MRQTDGSTALDISTFALHGFDHLQAELVEALANVEVRRGEPQAPAVTDAVFVPASKVGLHLFEGALLTGDGQPISQARSLRRESRMGDIELGSLSQTVALEPQAVIEEEVVYLGWYFDHFGHFLLESLARTWILPELDPGIKVVWHRERPTEPGGSMLRLLELLGIDRERMLFPTEQTLLRRVIVPEPLYEISHAAHERMPEPYRRIAATVVPSPSTSEQPLYLSRRLLSSRQRPIIGELELEEVLRENGFLIAYPETMSLTDQIRLVNRHRDIFTSAGSAAYLPLFAQRPTRLHVLTENIPFVDYFLIPMVAEMEASYLNCLGGGNRPAGHYLPLLVQMDRVTAYLDQAGMLKRTLRGELTTRVANLQPAYDEAWLYKRLRYSLRTEPLDAELEAEAVELAVSSWPLCWTLARYCLSQDASLVDPLVRRFLDLVATEQDVARLAHYQDDLARSAPQLAGHCSPETLARLAGTLRDRFLIDLDAEIQTQAERRRHRRMARATDSAATVTD